MTDTSLFQQTTQTIVQSATTRMLRSFHPLLWLLLVIGLVHMLVMLLAEPGLLANHWGRRLYLAADFYNIVFVWSEIIVALVALLLTKRSYRPGQRMLWALIVFFATIGFFGFPELIEKRHQNTNQLCQQRQEMIFKSINLFLAEHSRMPEHLSDLGLSPEFLNCPYGLETHAAYQYQPDHPGQLGQVVISEGPHNHAGGFNQTAWGKGPQFVKSDNAGS